MITIITPCLREENLGAIAKSILYAGMLARWMILPGDKAQGYEAKNTVLDHGSIPPDDWVWFLDDDNACHPEFLKRIESVTEHNMVLVAQRRGRDVRPPEPKAGWVDMAQVVVKRSLIGDLRFNTHYAADGEWIERLTRTAGCRLLKIPEVLCSYNALRP